MLIEKIPLGLEGNSVGAVDDQAHRLAQRADMVLRLMNILLTLKTQRRKVPA
jgi:hypothetical protein